MSRIEQLQKMYTSGQHMELEKIYGVPETISDVRYLLTALEKCKTALEFVTMPITTPKENLTVEGLLETIANDDEKAKACLAEVFGEEN